MDPKDNASSSNGNAQDGNDAQNNGGVPGDGTQNPGFDGSPSAPPDVSVGGASAGSDQSGPQSQGVEVDLSGAGGASNLTDSATSGVPGLGSDPGAMPSIGGETGAGPTDSTGVGSNPTDVAFGATQDAGVGQSGLPADPATSSPADPATPLPDPTTPAPGAPTTPGFSITGATSASPTDSPLPSIGTDPGVSGQVSTPAPDQQTGGISPTAPVPAHPHGADKKTIIVLAGIALILIVAIVVLFLL